MIKIKNKHLSGLKMKKGLFLFIFFGLLINWSSAQSDISVSNSCITKNSILLAQELIRTLGKDKVSEIVEKDIRLLLFFDVDSIGNVTLAKSLINDHGSNETQDSSRYDIEGLKLDLEQYLKIDKGYFTICYERFPDKSDSASIEIISKDLFKDNKPILLNVGFPGELLMYYKLDNEKLMQDGKGVTKYEYLEKKINNTSELQ